MEVRNSGVDISQVFAKITSKGQDKISQDELLIGLSRVSNDINLRECKDLFRILMGPGAMVHENAQVPINEAI